MCHIIIIIQKLKFAMLWRKRRKQLFSGHRNAGRRAHTMAQAAVKVEAGSSGVGRVPHVFGCARG